MVFDLFALALKNIRRKKLRSVLTMLGIIIGVASVAVVMAIGSGGKAAIAGELDRFGLNGLSVKGITSEDGRKGKLTDNEYNKVVDAFSEAKEVMPLKIYSNCTVISYERKKSCMVWGIGDNA